MVSILKDSELQVGDLFAFNIEFAPQWKVTSILEDGNFMWIPLWGVKATKDGYDYHENVSHPRVYELQGQSFRVWRKEIEFPIW